MFHRLTPLIVRAMSTMGGIGILYHEVWVSDTAEPLLVFAGLWLAGAPIADLLDKLRRLASEVQTSVPSPPEPPVVDPPTVGGP